MMKYDVENLYNKLQSLVGKQVWIAESLSRNRQVGHDRHFATSSIFMLILERISWSFSGANLHLDGTEGFSYSLSSLNIVEFSTDEKGRLTIVEHFESKTERRITLWANHQPTD
jgi:hypothetical protein